VTPTSPLPRAARPRICQLEESASFDRQVIHYIQRAPATGLYEIRGLGAKRRLPHFDDLVFWARRCHVTRSRATARNALRPRSWHTLCEAPDRTRHADYHRRHELRGTFRECEGSPRAGLPTELGTSTTTGDGGMTRRSAASSKTLVYQCLPSRYGFNPDDVRKADAIEIVIGQGASRAAAACCWDRKWSPRVAR